MGTRNAGSGRTLSEYHELRNQEAKVSDPAKLEAAVRSGGSGGSGGDDFPERVALLLPLSGEPSDEVDGKLTELCELYLSGSPEQRAFIRSMIGAREGGELQGFSMRMAIAALRNGSERSVLTGLVAHSVENLASGDVRDNLILITLLFHAAKRINSDSFRLFREVAAISGAAMSAVLLDYLLRSPELQRPECMGYREIATPEGPTFAPVRFKPGL